MELTPPARRSHEGWMSLAIREARLAAEAGEVPVGAVVVRDGAVIARGRNRREAEGTALGHAELEAIAAACREVGDWRLTGCTLYVTLEPCCMCAGACLNARLDRVVYGAADQAADEEEVAAAADHEEAAGRRRKRRRRRRQQNNIHC